MTETKKCTLLSKVRYKDHDTAIDALLYMQRTSAGKKPVRVFYCHHCLGYHITAQKKDAMSGDGGESRKKSYSVKDWLLSVFR